MIARFIKNGCVALMVLAATACGRVDDSAMPDDLKVTAEFSVGTSSSYRYETIISEEGTCKQEYLEMGTYEEVKKEYKISKSSVSKIKDAVTSVEFFSLPEEIAGGGEDQPGLMITIKRGKSTHSVMVLAPNNVGAEHTKELERFNALWKAIHNEVPSPYKG